MSDIKMSDDSEFKCLRRISCLLGLSMPESDADLMTLSTLRIIERGLKSAFKEESAQLNASLKKLQTELGEQDFKIMSLKADKAELVGALEGLYKRAYKNQIAQCNPLVIEKLIQKNKEPNNGN